MHDIRKIPWWSAPLDKRFEAYYLTLRIHYGMPALEAFRYAKRHFRPHLIEEIREAISA